MAKGVARGHHYVSDFYLRGFATSSGIETGKRLADDPLFRREPEQAGAPRPSSVDKDRLELLGSGPIER